MFLLAFFLYGLTTGLPMRPVVQTVLVTAGYVANYVTIKAPRYTPILGTGHLWSLSVEEQFYFVYPAILIVLLRAKRKWLVPVVLTAGAVAIVFHRAHGWGTDHSFDRLDAMLDHTDYRADGLLIGALAAWVWYYRRVPRWILGAAATGATVGLLWVLEHATLFTRWLYFGGMTLFDVCVAVIILAAVAGWRGARPLEWAPLRLLGRVSYGLYLWHFLMISIVRRYGSDWSPSNRVLVAYAASAACTAASWMLVERPALRLKVRLEERARERDRPGAARGRARQLMAIGLGDGPTAFAAPPAPDAW